MENNNFTSNKNEYILIVDLLDFYQNKADTTTSWAQKFSNNLNANKNSISIYALFKNEIKKFVFTEKDLEKISKIYYLVRIYFKSNFVNLVCENGCNGNSIWQRIEQLPEIKKMIMEKLNLEQYNMRNVSIKAFGAIADNINYIYNLEIEQKNNEENFKNQVNPLTYTDLNCGQTRLILKNLDTFINHKTYVHKKINKNGNDVYNSANMLNYCLANNNFNFNQINANAPMINSDNNFPSRVVNKFLNKNNMNWNNLQNIGPIL